MSTFQDAMPTDWIDPGETATVEVDEWPIGIANVASEFFAFQALCPHQGSMLAGRPLEQDCIIVCPHHASRYDVRSGECVKPASDGFNQDLMVYATRVIDDVVQVDL